jgi:hypothetical protein
MFLRLCGNASKRLISAHFEHASPFYRDLGKNGDTSPMA